jgi:hypothetical protein
MYRALLRGSAAVVIILGLAACSSGPGQNLEIDGTYQGTLQGTPRTSITLIVRGSSITGTGTVDPAENNNVWRGNPGATDHVTFSGNRNGRRITTLTGVSQIQRNITPQPGTTPTWVEANPTISLAPAEFNENGGITGSWQGETIDQLSVGGSWSAVRTGGASSGITGPPK